MNEEEILALQDEGEYLDYYVDEDIIFTNDEGGNFLSIAFSQRAITKVTRHGNCIYERSDKK